MQQNQPYKFSRTSTVEVVSTVRSSLSIILFQAFTRGTMKCPKKYVKDVFFTWGHMHFILKCPKIEDFHFRFISRFQTSHVFFLWNAPIFYVRIFWNAPFFPFSESDGKNGAFQEKRTEKSGAFREKSTWSIWKREKNRKWICSILGHFRKNCICSHVKNTSFKGFLGHFKIPP